MAAHARRIGVVGKTPRQADFVRLNAATPLALQLHGWLQEGVERARRADAQPVGARPLASSSVFRPVSS